MIDNTSSAVDAGSLTPQAKASAANLVKTDNISKLAKTEVTAPEKVVTQVDKAKESTETPPQEIEQIVEKLNAFVQLTQRDVSFGIDQQSGRDVISVFEADTQELIRQIPSEEALELLKRMDKAIGLLFSEKV
jgi:flagellar protein FlaG